MSRVEQSSSVEENITTVSADSATFANDASGRKRKEGIGSRGASTTADILSRWFDLQTRTRAWNKISPVFHNCKYRTNIGHDRPP